MKTMRLYIYMDIFTDVLSEQYCQSKDLLNDLVLLRQYLVPGNISHDKIKLVISCEYRVTVISNSKHHLSYC